MVDLIWVVSGDSESGDEYMETYGRKPSEEELEELAFRWDGDKSDPTGPGDYGSYVYLVVRSMKLENGEYVLT